MDLREHLKPDEQEHLTAIHEAGHAVGQYRLLPSYFTHDVSIVPNMERGSLGANRGEEVNWPADVPLTPQQETDLENEKIVYCCGYGAVLAHGYSRQVAQEGCQDDFAHASESGTALDFLKEKAVDLMSRPENLRAVSILAEVLLEKKQIYGGTIELLVDLADGTWKEEEFWRYQMSAHREDIEAVCEWSKFSFIEHRATYDPATGGLTLQPK